jgi:hypothetical protein
LQLHSYVSLEWDPQSTLISAGFSVKMLNCKGKFKIFLQFFCLVTRVYVKENFIYKYHRIWNGVSICVLYYSQRRSSDLETKISTQYKKIQVTQRSRYLLEITFYIILFFKDQYFKTGTLMLMNLRLRCQYSEENYYNWQFATFSYRQTGLQMNVSVATYQHTYSDEMIQMILLPTLWRRSGKLLL